MEYSDAYISRVKTEFYALTDQWVKAALATGTLEELTAQYGISADNDVFAQPIHKRMTVLVLGDLSGSPHDYLQAAKRLGFEEDNLEFIEFDKIKNLNVNRFYYSDKYSDIIIGPIPHSARGKGEATSIIDLLQNIPDDKKPIYPKVITARANETGNRLKFSISNFREALQNTRLYLEIHND